MTNNQESDLTVEELVARSVRLRKELVPAGVEVDATNSDTVHGMQRCHEESLSLLSLPKKYGGLSTGDTVFATEAAMEIATNLGASDSALTQNWGTNQLVLREIFNPHNEELLSEEARLQIANEILAGPARLVASNSETGSPKKVVGRKVPGGIRVSGTKMFNSNSGSGGYAFSGFKGEDGTGIRAIIPLNAEGVTLHGDWDNMGQRGTQSQAITYDDVFIPDGWHFSAQSFDVRFVPYAFLFHGVIVLSSAMGALDTAIDQLRKSDRVILGGEFKTSTQDPLMMRRLGQMSAQLRAAYVMQQKVARDLENLRPGDDIWETYIDAIRSKSVNVEVGVEATQALFDMLGARATANRNRFDRFWRNARTFACHDPLDILHVVIGRYEITKEPPNFFATYAHLLG